MAVTHGHGDHAGCIDEFETVYLPYKDIDMLNQWFEFNIDKNHVTDLNTLNEIDLGGVSLEVIQVPGHTPGSVALLFRDKEYLFTSDCIGSGVLWMQLPNSLSLTEYLEALLNLENELKSFDHLKIFVGHPVNFESYFETSYLKDLIRLTKSIIDGTIIGTPTENPDDFFGGYKASYGEVIGLLYKRVIYINRIFIICYNGVLKSHKIVIVLYIISSSFCVFKMVSGVSF